MSQTENMLTNYSLQEQWTGRYWIDKKKIYQKTYTISPLSSTAIDTAHNIADFESLVTISAVAYGTDPKTGKKKHLEIVSCNNSTIMAAILSIRVEDDKIKIRNLNGVSYLSAHVTLFYTRKTQ